MNPPRIRLITRGDDCGSNHTANVATLNAFKNGILKNTSIMVPCSKVKEAAEMLAGEGQLCCGLHCTVTAEWDDVRWGPVLPPEDVPSLVDRRGMFFQTTRALHDNQPRLDELMRELQAQLDRARTLGFDIRYADQHMDIGQVVDGLDQAFDAWCRREGIRNSRPYNRHLPAVEMDGDPVEQLIACLGAAPPGQYLIVGHPAYDNEEMRALGHEGYPGDVIAVERDWQRRLFVDPRMVDYCRQNGVLPIRYDEAL
jgi:predicted glycoside hydrolase/deacetylase ChbG (UPF0249 family)